MTRKEFIGGAAAFAAAGTFGADAADSPQLVQTKKWLKEAQFGMMAHWGLYTLGRRVERQARTPRKPDKGSNRRLEP